MKILVTPTSLHPSKKSKYLDELREFSEDLIFNETGKPLTEEELIPLLKDCDGYIAGLDFVTRKAIESAPNLKVISRYGVGYERVDIEAAKENGVVVTNTPGANSEAVGELTVGLIISLARRIPYLNEQTRSGEWIRSTGIELKDKTIGIVGLGAIGKVVARCAKGFGMKIKAYDPFIDTQYCKDNDIEIRSFDEIIAESNMISLHLPLNDETKHIINKETINKLQKGTIIINTSRGGLIDEDAAYEALKSGKLGGLGLDAFEVEPPKESPLFGLDNVVVTPHTGAHTKEATDNMARMSVRNLIAILTGKDTQYIVNK